MRPGEEIKRSPPPVSALDLQSQRSSIFETINNLTGAIPDISRDNISRENSQGGANVLGPAEESAVSVLESTMLSRKQPALNIQYGTHFRHLFLKPLLSSHFIPSSLDPEPGHLSLGVIISSTNTVGAQNSALLLMIGR